MVVGSLRMTRKADTREEEHKQKYFESKQVTLAFPLPCILNPWGTKRNLERVQQTPHPSDVCICCARVLFGRQSFGPDLAHLPHRPQRTKWLHRASCPTHLIHKANRITERQKHHGQTTSMISVHPHLSPRREANLSNCGCRPNRSIDFDACK